MQVHRRLRQALIGTALLPVVACRDTVDAPLSTELGPDDVVISIDGVTITKKEIEEFDPYFRDISPTTGHMKSLRYLLDRHLIPLKFAEREFAAERLAQRERAQGMAKVPGDSAGYDDLLERTRLNENAEVQTDVQRQSLPLPEARWLFDDANLGRVSPVLETSQGFSLVASSEKIPGMTKAYDSAHVLLVRFYTHKAKAHADWARKLKLRLAALPQDRIRVHPDYRDAIPYWPKR